MNTAEQSKAWHAMDPTKAQYFLVDLPIPQIEHSSKTTVAFSGEQYQVLSQELLQYDPRKDCPLHQLRFANEPEIMNWLQLNGAEEGWVRLNGRVVLDFNT